MKLKKFENTVFEWENIFDIIGMNVMIENIYLFFEEEIYKDGYKKFRLLARREEIGGKFAFHLRF